MPCWFVPCGFSPFVLFEHLVECARLLFSVSRVLPFLFIMMEIIFAAIWLAAESLGFAKTSLAFCILVMGITLAIQMAFFSFAELLIFFAWSFENPQQNRLSAD